MEEDKGAKRSGGRVKDSWRISEEGDALARMWAVALEAFEERESGDAENEPARLRVPRVRLGRGGVCD